jgi:hypothetical protein
MIVGSTCKRKQIGLACYLLAMPADSLPGRSSDVTVAMVIANGEAKHGCLPETPELGCLKMIQ